MKIELNHPENAHPCYGVVEGEWIVFRCPVCVDYLRKIHTETGEMITKAPAGDTLHYGLYVKPGLDQFDAAHN